MTTTQDRRLTETIETLTRRISELEKTQQQRPTVTNKPRKTEGDEEKKKVYETINDFVDLYIRVMCETRNTGTLYWCDNWKVHSSYRVYGKLWVDFEESNRKETEPQFLVNRFYPLMDRILGPKGPHKSCEADYCAGKLPIGMKPAITETTPVYEGELY